MKTQQAINMIRDHGFHACMTADGLIANMECGIAASPVYPDVAFREGDIWFEETTVFAVDDNGHVDSTAIRAFLGY